VIKMFIYKVKNLQLVYSFNGRKIPVINNFSLEVKQGEFLALLGPSGSGKTSLINILAGFLRPTNGLVFYRDKNLTHLDTEAIAFYRNSEIGIVHQFFNLIPEFNALYNVMTPLLIKGVSLEKAKNKAQEMLEKVNLLHRAYHYPSSLSGGEQQRVAIARALINNPKVILADEPTGNLDKETSKQIFTLFKQLHQEGNTLIVATHDLVIKQYSTREVCF